MLLAVDSAGIDTIGFVEQLATDHPAVPIVLVADPVQGRIVQDAIEKGAHDVVWHTDLMTLVLRRTITRAREQAHAHYVDRRMARVMERSNDVVLVLNAEGEADYVSPSFERVTGFPITPPGKRETLDLTHPDDVHRVRAALRAVREGPDRHVTVEYRGRHADGTWHWREMDVSNLLDDPLVNGVVLTVRDINDRRRADEAIRFRSRLLESLGQPVIATNELLEIEYWNAAAEALFGWSAAEAIGRPISEVTATPEQWAAIAAVAVASRADESNDLWAGDFYLTRKDGTSFPAHVTNTERYDEHGTHVGNIGVVTDLTERTRNEEARRRLSTIVESSVDAICSVDLDGTVTSWNRAASMLHGRRPSEVIGRSLEYLRTQFGIDLGLEEPLARLREGEPLNPAPVTTRPGDRHHANHFSPVRDPSGELTSVSVITRDVTDQIRLVERLETDRRRLAEAQRAAHLGSYEIEPGTRRLTWSEELYEIFGVPRDIEPTIDDYYAHIHPDDRDWATAALAAALDPGAPPEVIHRIVRHNDGAVRWISVRASRSTRGVIHGTVYDITELKEAEFELVHQAHHDPLTGLPNRTWLTEQLDRRCADARRSGRQLTVALFDVDKFKVINDSLGHAAGDRVLEVLASRLSQACRDAALVGRFGGDEFVVACFGPGRDDDGVADLGRRLIEVVNEPLHADGRVFHLTASIGITTTGPGSPPGSQLRAADAAMYEAKARGKNQWAHFDDNLRSRSRRRLQIEADLHLAIERGQMQVHYQPILSISTNRPVGFEALVRWEHPSLGFINPEEFIPVAEDTGLIVSIGEWVMHTAARTLAEWRRTTDLEPDVWMAVNLSTRQLASGTLAETLDRVLASTGLPAANLHLEVTESLLLDHASSDMDIIRAINDRGTPLSIDDFGTGYSSLSYLRRLPVQTLKIDRSFIAGVGREHEDNSIAATIIELAHGLGLNVVAEGVEDEVQLNALRRLGCEFGQGYLWSRPVPAELAQGWLPCRVS